jgi:membrane-bound ClpP family serine protease
MRILSGILFICGVVSLYFGMVMLLFFSGEAHWVNAVLVKSSLVLLAGLLLLASGLLWFRAKQLDLAAYEPERATAQTRSRVNRSMGLHMAAFFLAGFVLVSMVYVWLVNR